MKKILISNISFDIDTVQEQCLVSRRKLYYDAIDGFNYAAGRILVPVAEIEAEESRLAQLTNGLVKFTLVSHRELWFGLDGCDKLYHLAAPNKYGNIGSANDIDSPAVNPYLRIAHTLKQAIDDQHEYDCRYQTVINMPNLLEDVDAKTFASLSETEVRTITGKIWESLNRIGIDNLYYTRTRAYINNILQALFDDVHLQIIVNENHILCVGITSNKQGAEVMQGNGSVYLRNCSDLTDYVIRMHRVNAKQIQIKNEIKTKKKQNDNIMKSYNQKQTSSAMQTKSAQVSVSQVDAKLIATSIAQLVQSIELIKFLQIGGYSLEESVKAMSGGRLSATLNCKTLTLTGKFSLTTVNFEDVPDDAISDVIEESIEYLMRMEDRLLRCTAKCCDCTGQSDTTAVSADSGAQPVSSGPAPADTKASEAVSSHIDNAGNAGQSMMPLTARQRVDFNQYVREHIDEYYDDCRGLSKQQMTTKRHWAMFRLAKAFGLKLDARTNDADLLDLLDSESLELLGLIYNVAS